MSYWTYILTSIDVDTHKRETNIKEVVEKMLEKAPKISGSERDADVFVNVLSDYNCSTTSDCEHCKFKDTIIHCDDNGTFSCDADKNYNCPSGQWQSRVIITITGNLRDRSKEETVLDYINFRNFITKDCNFEIRNEIINIKPERV